MAFEYQKLHQQINLFTIISLYQSTMSSAFIQINKPFYFAGETIQGQVYLYLTEPINAHQIILKFKGWESVRWIQERVLPEQQRLRIQANLIGEDNYRVQMQSSDSEDDRRDDSMKYKYVKRGYQVIQIIRHTGGKVISRFMQPLYNFGGSFIPPGQYTFPFIFKTGEEYPASFADKQAASHARGRIKYEMQAFIRGTNNRLRIIKAKTQIIIRQTAPIKNEQQQMEAHVKSCCCCDQGITRIRCFFQKNAYAPGEEAKMYCVLNNKQGKAVVERVSVSLRNQITYISKQKHRKSKTEIVFDNTFSGMQPGEEGEREQVVRIQNQKNKTNPLDIKPTSSKGSFLKSTYYLQVEAVLSASCTCCSQLPIVRQPILIYPWIPVINIFQQPSNWNPEVMQTMNFKVNIDPANNNLGNMENPYQ